MLARRERSGFFVCVGALRALFLANDHSVSVLHIMLSFVTITMYKYLCLGTYVCVYAP